MDIKSRYRPYTYLAEYYDRIFTPGVSSVQEEIRQALLGKILERQRYPNGLEARGI
jgi:hypothetical protein